MRSPIILEEEEQTIILAPPTGLNLFPSLRPPLKTLTFHQFSVLLITFLAYASFHASLKPPSIVKSVLGPEIRSENGTSSVIDEDPAGINASWAPFNESDGLHRLGELDLAFLSAYAVGMYFAGHIGDRMDLRVFLTIGMMGSGGNDDSFRSIGWPCVVAVVGNWFGKSSKRGLIMGVWASHTWTMPLPGTLINSGVTGLAAAPGAVPSLFRLIAPKIKSSPVLISKPAYKPDTPSKYGGSFPNSPQSTKVGLVGRIDLRPILSPGRVSPIDSQTDLDDSVQESVVSEPPRVSAANPPSRSDSLRKLSSQKGTGAATTSRGGLEEIIGCNICS